MRGENSPHSVEQVIRPGRGSKGPDRVFAYWGIPAGNCTCPDGCGIFTTYGTFKKVIRHQAIITHENHLGPTGNGSDGLPFGASWRQRPGPVSRGQFPATGGFSLAFAEAGTDLCHTLPSRSQVGRPVGPSRGSQSGGGRPEKRRFTPPNRGRRDGQRPIGSRG